MGSGPFKARTLSLSLNDPDLYKKVFTVATFTHPDLGEPFWRNEKNNYDRQFSMLFALFFSAGPNRKTPPVNWGNTTYRAVYSTIEDNLRSPSLARLLRRALWEAWIRLECLPAATADRIWRSTKGHPNAIRNLYLDNPARHFKSHDNVA